MSDMEGGLVTEERPPVPNVQTNWLETRAVWRYSVTRPIASLCQLSLNQRNHGYMSMRQTMKRALEVGKVMLHGTASAK